MTDEKEKLLKDIGFRSPTFNRGYYSLVIHTPIMVSDMEIGRFSLEELKNLIIERLKHASQVLPNNYELYKARILKGECLIPPPEPSKKDV